jgi:hypothetical protein
MVGADRLAANGPFDLSSPPDGTTVWYEPSRTAHNAVRSDTEPPYPDYTATGLSNTGSRGRTTAGPDPRWDEG